MPEEARETLRDYDTVIIVDNSGSMYGRRWKEVSAMTQHCADDGTVLMVNA